MKAKKQNKGITAQALIIVCFCAMFLYFDNAYFNITKAKAHMFYIIMSSFLPFIVFQIVKHKECFNPKTITLTEYSLISLLIFSLTSSLLSDEKLCSFIGNKGWYVGSLTIILCTLLFIFISRTNVYSHNIWLTIFIILDIVLFIALLNFCGIDVFSMHKGIGDNPKNYVSTIGNLNRFSCMLCIFLPPIFIFFLSSNVRKTRLFYLLSLLLLIICALLSACDTVYLGFGIAFIFAIPYICKSVNHLLDTLFILMISVIALDFINIIPIFKEIRQSSLGVSKFILNITHSSVFTAFFVLIFIIALLLRNKIGEKALKTIKYTFVFLFTAIAIGYFIYTAINITDEWGSYRGAIFKATLREFSNQGIKGKLFGIGPELAYKAYNDMYALFGMRCLVSHSEYLQTLLTTGIFGFTAYLCIIISVIIDYFKNKAYKDDAIAFILPCIAYFACAAVNSASSANLVFIVLIYAVGKSYSKSK